MYIYDSELASYLIVENFISFQFLLFIISFLFAIVIIKTKINMISSIGKRLLLCLLMPLIIGFIYVLIIGNDIVTALIIRMRIEHLSDFLDPSVSLITILSGQIFIKPWKRLLNFAVGILYVAVMYNVHIFYMLILTGLIHDNWL